MARAENWRSVPGYPDIEISDELVVRSKARTTEYIHPLWGEQKRHFLSKVLKVQWQHTDGYATVFVNSVRRPVGLHVIVCAAFLTVIPQTTSRVTSIGVISSTTQQMLFNTAQCLAVNSTASRN